MWIKLFEGDKTDPTPGLYKIINDSRIPEKNPNGITAMLVVFDEIHQIYSKKTHYANAMVAMREKYEGIDWAVMGISSTPELDAGSAAH